MHKVHHEGRSITASFTEHVKVQEKKTFGEIRVNTIKSK